MRLRMLDKVSRPGLHFLFALVVVLFAGLSCRSFDDRTGSSGINEGPEVDVTGTWSGTWSMTVGVPDSGTVTFDIEQDSDGNVFGQSEWIGSPCWTNPIPDFIAAYDPGVPVPTRFKAIIEGTVMLNATVMEILRDPPPAPRRDDHRATGRLEVVADRIVGTFTVTAPFAASGSDATTRCDDKLPRLGDQGVLELRRS